MKEFRKTENGAFICEECGKTYVTKIGLVKHIFYSHKNLLKQTYYDKWLKEKNEGLCKICSKKTSFDSINKGYNNCCSKECSNKYTQKQTEKSNLLLYGVKNIFQRNKIKEKCKQTKKERYGDEKYQNWEKRKATHLAKYGVEYPMQNKKSFEKQQRNSYYCKLYKNTKIYYRSSYEFNFLENFYNFYPDIINPKGIKYDYENKHRYYFPDFYIPSLNLIIECKNSYLAELDKEQIQAKEKATIANGFKYIIIVDKDYSKFNLVF